MPHPRDDKDNQIPPLCPAPPPLRLYIDRCITHIKGFALLKVKRVWTVAKWSISQKFVVANPIIGPNLGTQRNPPRARSTDVEESSSGQILTLAIADSDNSEEYTFNTGAEGHQST